MSTESTGTSITGWDEAALWRTTRAFLLCFKDNTILFCHCQKSCCFCCYPRQDHWQLWELAYALVGRFGSTWDPLHPRVLLGCAMSTMARTCWLEACSPLREVEYLFTPDPPRVSVLTSLGGWSKVACCTLTFRIPNLPLPWLPTAGGPSEC